jgi:hypothetical protein
VHPSQFAPRFLTRYSQDGQYRGRTSNLPRDAGVDVIFILALLALYAATHWLIVAVERLGSVE